MTDAAPPPADIQLSILAQFVRDLSFENPGAGTRIDTRPDLPVRIDANARQIPSEDGEQGLYEVSLKIEAKAIVENRNIYVTSLDYVGIFRLTGAPQNMIEPILLAECPRILFPFARRVVADATRDGGYPPLLLDPVDFMALYRQRLDAVAAQRAQQPTGQA
ncbi:protein-export chaperone SecB [Neomegalonema sp.]|uniref:protein-export chaperone SecB n=1 Tax=Neomegalonema sp. TaxID=2039713 RepID=UPI00262DD75C|nr:protein-export chaperone SecB [Neomegalonema sp.]MDD2867101.1 protein-export chaperone SecB [Neomegalonema sp.]